MKLFIVVGTRPEAIKLAPVIHHLKKDPGAFSFRVCLTGQHRELIDPALRYFGIHPDHDLNILKQGQTLFDITSKVMAGLTPILQEERPDMVMVQGDTASAFAGALAASFLRIPVCHVEAGLRTGSLNAPFPEEQNRRLIAVLSSFHFAPTDAARDNLIKEGVPLSQIHVTGNTSIDALLYTLKQLEESSAKASMAAYFRNQHALFLPRESGDGEGGAQVILVTVHRRENVGASLTAICNALIRIEEEHPNAHIAFCHHLNGRITLPMRRLLEGRTRIHLIPPLGYPQFIYLLKNVSLVLTDSGGVQEEAAWLGKPFFILRSETERMEAVSAGIGALIGTDEESICGHVNAFLHGPSDPATGHMGSALCFGDGRAGKRIVGALSEYKPAPI